MDCRVVVEAAVQVYDVSSPDEAVRIAISKTGNQLNPDLNYVEISPGSRDCEHCGSSLEPAFVAADEALVALELEMDVFTVDREEHAQRIARKEIGQRLTDVPLTIVDVVALDGTAGDGDDAGTEGGDGDGSVEAAGDETGPGERGQAAEEGDPATTEEGDSATTEEGDSATDDADVLPEFEDILEESDST